jgi:hypothetical protein
MAGAPSTFVTLGDFRNTHNDTVSGTASNWASPGPYTQYVVLATVDTCLRLKLIADGSDGLATTNDFLLLAGTYARMEIDPLYELSWIAGPGATDGTIKITEAAMP